MTKGDWLDGYYTSRPLLNVDGTAYFFRKGTMMAARDLTIDEQLPLTTPNDSLFATEAVGGSQGLCLAYARATEPAAASLVRIDL